MKQSLNLAFCLFGYFPYGGMQRDFMRIASRCLERGHKVSVYTLEWEGAVPPGMALNLLDVSGVSNHRRCQNFSEKAVQLTRQGAFDAVVGFNKMAGLDVYFAADTCYAEKSATRSWFYRNTARCRTYRALEQSVFSTEADCEILLLAQAEKHHFMHWYGTPESRFHLVPPGIDPPSQCIKERGLLRREVRQEFAVKDDAHLVLMVGSGFSTKGVDRALKALAALPEDLRSVTRLLVVGKGDAKPFRALAGRLKVGNQIHFAGTRDDVPRLMMAADLLLHPAYTEAAGMVLLEALTTGLPVLVTENCGFAFHVREANAGMLVPHPFRQSDLDRGLFKSLTSSDRLMWQRNGLDYAKRTDLYSLADKASDIIEAKAEGRDLTC